MEENVVDSLVVKMVNDGDRAVLRAEIPLDDSIEYSNALDKIDRLIDVVNDKNYFNGDLKDRFEKRCRELHFDPCDVLNAVINGFMDYSKGDGCYDVFELMLSYGPMKEDASEVVSVPEEVL